MSHPIVAPEHHDLESVAGDETAHTGLTHRGRASRVVRIRGLFRELWHDKAGMLGMIFLISWSSSRSSPRCSPPTIPKTKTSSTRLRPPFWMDGGSWTYPLGTDGLGHDVLSRLMYGARISLLVGVAVVAVAGGVGIVLGLLAGYRGGLTDRVSCDPSTPRSPSPAYCLRSCSPPRRPERATVIIVLAVNGWMVYARMARGVVLSVKETAYVEAAEIIGCRPKRVMFTHILPNLAAPLTTLAVLEFARIVLAEAALSYLGVGVKRTDISWGLDVAGGQDFIFNSWWLVVMPGALISLTVLSVNLVASWLRIVSDPAEREKRYAATHKPKRVKA